MARSTEAMVVATRLYVECTHTYQTHINTGIQRVVRNILVNLPLAAADCVVVPVITTPAGNFIISDEIQFQVIREKRPPGFSQFLTLRFSQFLTLRFWKETVKARLGFLRWPVMRLYKSILTFKRGFDRKRAGAKATERRSMLSEMKPGDVLLLLDSSWANGEAFWKEVWAFRRRGGKVVSVIYDIIPLTHPHTASDDLVSAFTKWLNYNLEFTDVIAGISKSVTDSVVNYVEKHLPHRASLLYFTYFHLGTNLDLRDQKGPSERVIRAFASAERSSLVVGSIEPRKNHRFVLRAFEQLWEQGGQNALVILYSSTWKMDAFLRSLKRHRQINKKLFLFKGVSDGDIDYAYRSASNLIMASEAEGFGLPIVEAFGYGLPVLCSDIEPFREIASGAASFFSLTQPEGLVDLLLEADLKSRANPTPRQPRPWINWEQSAQMLFKSAIAPLIEPPPIQPIHHRSVAEKYPPATP